MGLPGSQKEQAYETGMDEQAKQSAMNQLGESVITNDRGNDRSSDYYEELRHQYLANKQREEALMLGEREHSLTERRNREAERSTEVRNTGYATHLSNLSRAELDPIQSKSVTEVLNGLETKGLNAAIVAAVVEGLKGYSAK